METHSQLSSSRHCSSRQKTTGQAQTGADEEIKCWLERRSKHDMTHVRRFLVLFGDTIKDHFCSLNGFTHCILR
jgi:hypothetical protein